MIGIGLAITALSMFHMTTFNTNMDYRYVMLARCFPVGRTGVFVCAYQHRRLRVCASQ